MKKSFLPFLFLVFSALGVAQTWPTLSLAAEHGAKTEGEKSEGKGDKNITGGRFEGDPIYVRIAPMTLPIINDNGVEQIVSVIVTVQVKDLDSANVLHKNMPRATDSLLRHLYGGLDEGSVRKGKLVNIPKIKKKAVEAIAEIVERKNIVDVLVEGVAQRML